MFESIVRHGTYDKKTLTVKAEPGFDDSLFVTTALDMHGDTVSLTMVLGRDEVRDLRDKLTAWLSAPPGGTIAAGPPLHVVK